MSSTNKTTNYNLSQFIGSDKPTFLGDYNGDMAKIDTQMKTNATGIASATAGVETALENSSTALTNSNEALTTANEANTTATSAQSTASTAGINAQTALNLSNTNASMISALQDYLNLNNYNEYTNSGISGSCKIATNNTGSLAKIYGRLYYSMSGAWQNNFTITGSSLRPSEQITIANAGIVQNTANNEVGVVNITISPNGNITLNMTHGTNANATFYAYFFPCLYFMQNFGDTSQD